MFWTYLLIAAILLLAELGYFNIADNCNIIDKPNVRSSHSKAVIRGGGVIFTVGLWVWSIIFGFQYPWLLAAVTLAAGVSFIDDIQSLPDGQRLLCRRLRLQCVRRGQEEDGGQACQYGTVHGSVVEKFVEDIQRADADG